MKISHLLFPLFRISADFHFFDKIVETCVESNSFKSSENWLVGDENQLWCSYLRSS